LGKRGGGFGIDALLDEPDAEPVDHFSVVTACGDGFAVSSDGGI
jgi:hypothetical protein